MWVAACAPWTTCAAAQCGRGQDQFLTCGYCQPAGHQPTPRPGYGSQCIVVAIDAKRRFGDDVLARGEGWDVYSHGGRKNTGLTP